MGFSGQGKIGFDSAFARQIDAGFPWLRFVEELEPGFREDHRERTLPFVRAAMSIALGLILIYVGIQSARGGGLSQRLPELLPMMLFAALLLVTIVTSFVSSDRPYRGLLTATAAAAALGAVVLNLLAPPAAAQLGFAVIPVVIAFIYFALALLLRSASLIAVGATVVYAIGGLAAGLPQDLLISNVVVLFLASIICSIGGYMLEHSLRKAYLEGQLLGEMVDRDGLTGLFNRRAFDSYLNQAWNIARRQRAPLSLVLVDIDHFKPYNDHHGHQAGDDCLQRVAHCVSKIARRPLDFAARYGGEEFVVILYGVDHATAKRLAVGLVEQVSQLRILHEGSDVEPVVTISAGVASVLPAETDRSPQGVIQLADRSLYRAKREGRNRVVGEAADDAFIQTGIFEVS
jgi:diguanylate cyclase (GGDEF)-like protein